MAKNKIEVSKRPKSKVYIISIIILILVFVVLIISNSIKQSSNQTVERNFNQNNDVYKFVKQGELTFQKSSGEFISLIDIEFADNQNKRAQGLMFRTALAENQGMLFVFPFEEIQSFWMKNTILPLDMLFINSNFKIITIHKNTEPYSTKSYPSSAPALYVLEVNAGYTDKFNIKEGDKVLFRRI